MKNQVLICLALSWAGLSTTNGQVGIVSYATLTIPSGFSLLANPLSSGVTNGANEIALLIDGEKILTWNGLGFDTYSYDSVFGWRDANSQPAAPPSLPPGKGFFFFNPGASHNITLTGQVLPGPGTTNSLILPSGYSLVGSPLPANVANISSAPVNLPLIDGMQILTWNGSGFTFSLYDSGFGGWVDANLKPKTAPSYSIGQGFFIFNPRAAVTWEQSMP